LKAQHASNGTPLIIRSSKLQIEFRAPDDEQCAVRNIVSLQ